MEKQVKKQMTVQKREPLRSNNWKKRLFVEYWQLSHKLERLEMSMISPKFHELSEENQGLLQSQRQAMIDYKDCLFQRACLNKINLFEKRILHRKSIETNENV